MIDSIAHLADIHIRLFKRHDEFKSVFQTLYADLKEWRSRVGNGVIVLTGDIVHAKTDLSPEMVSIASDLFSELANIAPLIVIPGNHDLNLSNPNRMDAITPIISNLGNKNIHYLKESGIYPFDNIDFYVYSIVGAKDDWPDIKDNGQTKIGLYHGVVYNAQTDLGYVITTRHLELTQFDGLDILMLGDIHKYQTVQDRDEKNKKPIIVYPGSLIQQNHGELLTGHGWVEWDVRTRKHQFHEVINDYGYVTLTITPQTAMSILTDTFPKNTRLRLLVENIDAAGIKKIVSMIRRKTNVLESSISKLTNDTEDKIRSTFFVSDINDVLFQNNLITTYLNTNYPGISQEALDKIIEINTSYNSNIKEDELPKNIHWKPIKVKFDNLFSYGKGNEILFDGMRGIYGVFSPNATGKTSALDALCFALYDKTPRAFKGSHIMNTREKTCFCELEFEIENERYKVLRTGERKKNGEVKVDVEFSKLVNSNWVYLTGEDRRDTNSIIRSYVGDYDDFVLTNLSVQDQNSLFINKGQTEKKDLLSQFMGLTIFDKFYAMAANDSKEIVGSLKRFSDHDFSKELASIQEELDVRFGELEDVKFDIEKHIEEMSKLDNSILELTEKKTPIVGGNVDIKQLLNAQSSVMVEVDKYMKLLTDARELHSKIIFSSQEIENEIAKYKDIEKEQNEYKEMVLKKENLTEKLKISEKAIESYTEKIEWLFTHEYDPNCKFCMNNKFVIDAENSKILLKKELQIKDNIFSEMALLNTKLLEEFPKKYEEYEKLEKKRSALIGQKLTHELHISGLQSTLSKLEKQMSDIKLSIKQYYDHEATIVNNQNLEMEIVELKLKRATVSAKYKILEASSLSLNGEVEVLKSKKQGIFDKISEAEKLEESYEAYEYYMTAISRDGIPYQLICDTIPSIELSINQILSNIVDFNILMDVDGKNINARIVYDDDRIWPLELGSGMERFISGLAIRIALMSVSNLPRSNFLIIDEGFGVLDSNNMSSLNILFDILRKEFDFVILISHLDTIRDVADTLIDIKRENGYSYINVA